MSLIGSHIESSGETANADAEVCRKVGEILDSFYPNHGWFVGCANQATGAVVIDLPYRKPAHLRHFGYLLHRSSIEAPDHVKRIVRAGGELLERFGLVRGRKTEASFMKALENGLDAGNAVLKSRH